MTDLKNPEELALFCITTLSIIAQMQKKLISKNILEKDDLISDYKRMIKAMKNNSYKESAFLPYQMLIDEILMKPNHKGLIVLRNSDD